jgi:hypothetical protein
MQEQESILVEFVEEFAACVEIEKLFRNNKPTNAPAHEAGEIVLWTSARSHRTFKVMVKDCKLGYAFEAAKLNRSLFEDMVCAHWAQRFPKNARKLIRDHGQYTTSRPGCPFVIPLGSKPHVRELRDVHLERHAVQQLLRAC